MWAPRPEQAELALAGYEVLKQHMIVYLAMEERTGKSLTSVLIAECCQSVERVGIITTAKALGKRSTSKEPALGWLELFENYKPCFEVFISTYGKAPKEIPADVDLLIIDEAHKNISGYPKPSTTQRKLKKLSQNKPIIYLSATPHAQGYQMLYHQFDLSSWSPWKQYSTFYKWFDRYGVPQTQWIGSRETAIYTSTEENLIKATTDHLFLTRTRKELGFKYEPKDRIHYIKLDKKTRDLYNELVKNKCIYYEEETPFIADSPGKLRPACHMIEGGTLKLATKYITLDNTEKVDYILDQWGDSSDLVIFYNYKAELIKLGKYFKHAQLLQATSYAEGVDLTRYESIVVFSQDTSTARHTQRRARQASKSRDSEIVVHFLLVENAVSEQIYETVSVNKKNFVDSKFEATEL